MALTVLCVPSSLDKSPLLVDVVVGVCGRSPINSGEGHKKRMVKVHLPRVVYHQVYNVYSKKLSQSGANSRPDFQRKSPTPLRPLYDHRHGHAVGPVEMLFLVGEVPL